MRTRVDEPTTGLDPRSRGDVWAMIRELVAAGTTVLLTTQYLDEADRLASEIAVIDHGRVIATGTAAELKAKIGRQTLDVRPADPADLTLVAGILATAVGRDPARTEEDPGLLSVPVDDAQVLPAVVSELQAGQIEVTELALRLANPLAALGAVGLMLVFGFAVGWIWVLLGLYVKSPQSLQGFGFIVMFPLAFGSNVFIQTSTLPGWLQAWVRVNPVTALASASRGLMLGGSVATPAWHSIAWSIAITAVFGPLAVRRYRHIG